MIKVELIKTYGWQAAIRGMRNPLNSWQRTDSVFGWDEEEFTIVPSIGPNDLDLIKRLFNAGTEHRKYLRQIGVSMDITAPLYWWKEFDTYKVGTVANSCSTMHKIAAKEFVEEDFSVEHLNEFNLNLFAHTVDALNADRDKYLLTKSKDDWWQMIQMLPTTYNQKRTVTMNYENVFTIIRQRTGHKLDEWNQFVKILKTLPYVVEIGEFLV